MQHLWDTGRYHMECLWKQIISFTQENMHVIFAYVAPVSPWWCHQMERFSALLAICAGNSPVNGEFSTQRPATQSLDAFFDLRQNKRLCKQSGGWWFETPSRLVWRHRNVSPVKKWKQQGLMEMVPICSCNTCRLFGAKLPPMMIYF